MNKIIAAILALAGVMTVVVAAQTGTPLPQGTVTVEPLDSPAGPGAAEGNLAVGPDGRVYLSWLEPAPDSAMALKFADFDGKRWSAAKTVRTGRDFFVNWADFPSIAVNANGRIGVHWLQRHGAGSYAYDVRIAITTDGGRTWAPPMAPHVDRSSTEKGFVGLWPEGAGFGAVWLDGRKADKAGPAPKQEMMLYATPRAGVEQATETRLDERVCDCCQTTVALTNDGPIVAYRDRSPAEIRDISVVRRVNGAWLPPQPVSNDGWEINACPVNGPSLATAGRGVALAWFTAAKNTPRVKVAFSADAGATFGNHVVVDEGQPAGRVAAVMLADGSALVSWLERTGGDTASVRVRRVTPDGQAGRVVTVAASSAARASGFPRMVRSGDRVYFAWTLPGRPSAVRVARADAAAFR
jgi:hypothetical protein